MANQYLAGESGKQYMVVAGVIQHDGGSGWQLIPGGSHDDINISTVVADSTKIRVTYTFTATKAVVGMATPDETFINGNYATGASVGLTFMDIYIAQAGVAKNPTTTNIANANIWIFGIFVV